MTAYVISLFSLRIPHFPGRRKAKMRWPPAEQNDHPRSAPTKLRWVRRAG
jgi:hypothetical protein